MADWGTSIRDANDAILKNGPARAPATLDEIWDTEWKAAGLDTTFGVGKPMFEAYDEFVTRTQELTGKSVADLARERGLPAFAGGFDGQVDLLGRIVDTLPDHQQKLLTDYRDVRNRARQKAAEIEKRSEDVRGATYGLGANSVAFLSGVIRQMVDPVNLAMAPIGGPAKGPVLKWLGKEFAIGAGTQAVQEPYISTRRQELGLQSDSMMNIFEAGVGQAGFAGLMRAGAAALRAGRSAWRGPEVDITPADLDAVARHAERDAVFDRMMTDPIRGPESMEAATRAMNTGEPISGMAAARSTTLDLDGLQPIIRADGTRLEARYAVVERGQLVTSHTPDGLVNPAFPRELQPRDRSQGTSQLQVADIAGKLQPERLGPSPIAQEGAPIVGSDGIVESGNGRVLAIETAYSRFPDKAEAYRAYLESLGFDNVREMQAPVLVRIRQQELAPAERAAFASESNVATTGALSASERAFVDARGLHEGIMELWQGGQASDAKNAPFVRRFAGELLAPQEQKGFVDQDGRLAREGQDRIEAAVVARAYGDQTIVRELTESTDQRSKALLGAFADASPMVARLKSAVADGRVSAELDISRPLVDAFNMVDRARRTGAKLGDMLDQLDLERGAVPDDVRAAVQLFYRNEALTLPASRETVTERIAKAAEQAIMHQAGGFFGDALDAAAVLRAARFSTENLSSMDLARAMSEAAAEAKTAKPEIKAEKQPEVYTEEDWKKDTIARIESAHKESKVVIDRRIDMIKSGDLEGVLSEVNYTDLKGMSREKAMQHILENQQETLANSTRNTEIQIAEIKNGDPKIMFFMERGVADENAKRLQEFTSRNTAEPISGRAENTKTDPIEARINSAVEGLDPARQFEFEQVDGTMKKMTAAEQIEAIKAERKAADELNDCIDRAGGRIEDAK